MEQRRKAWEARMEQQRLRQSQREGNSDGSSKHATHASANLRVQRGVLAKYARLVRDASQGAVTDLF